MYGCTMRKQSCDTRPCERVLKHDLNTGESWTFHLGEGRACGDIRFAPSSEDGSSEAGPYYVSIFPAGTVSCLSLTPLSRFTTQRHSSLSGPYASDFPAGTLTRLSLKPLE